MFSPEIITILEKYKKVNLKKPYYFSDKQHKKVEAIERSKLRNIQKIIDKLGYLDNKNINLKNNLEIRVIGVGKKFRIRFENWQGYASKGFESIEIYNSTDSNNWLIA